MPLLLAFVNDRREDHRMRLARLIGPPLPAPLTGLFALLPLLAMRLAGCGGGNSDPTTTTTISRIVLVELASVPSGLPVNIRLNDTTLEARTPVAQHVRCDAVCTLVEFGRETCVLTGSATLKSGDPHGTHLTLCLTDPRDRECGSSNTGSVSVTLRFDVAVGTLQHR